MPGRRVTTTSLGPSTPAPGERGLHRPSRAPTSRTRGLRDNARIQVAAGLLSGQRNPRARRMVAALLAGAAVLALGSGLHGGQPAPASILVAAREISAGQVIGPDDLAPGRWGSADPVGLITDSASVIGRRSAVPIAQGMAIATNTLVGPSLLSEPGKVLAPVRLFDSGAGDLVVAGDRVDLLAAATGLGGIDGQDSPRPADIVATDVRVVATPQRDGGAGSSFAASETGGTAGGTVLLAVDRATAARIAAAAAIARLSLVVRSR